MLYLIEADSVNVHALSGMYFRKTYWRDIVFFGSVIIKINIGWCNRVNNGTYRVDVVDNK